MKRKPSLLVIYLSVFIDLIGFGRAPCPRLRGDNFSRVSQKGLVVGAIIASFSAMQFFCAVWGKLSDASAAAPSCSTAISAPRSYALFAVASGMAHRLLWILASRFSPDLGANFSVVSAYIADISPPQKRSAPWFVGMAFGLGFSFGPAIGAFSIEIFQQRGRRLGRVIFLRREFYSRLAYFGRK